MIIQILQVIAANWKCSMKLLCHHFRCGETDYSLVWPIAESNISF